MKLIIMPYDKNYVVKDEEGLTIRILTRKALEWNLKHAFGFDHIRRKEIDKEIQEKGISKVAV